MFKRMFKMYFYTGFAHTVQRNQRLKNTYVVPKRRAERTWISSSFTKYFVH